jgi:thiosulfate dehydrogenase (quinone) large subunit
MSDMPVTASFSWSLSSMKERPLRYLGVASAIFVRYFMGLFFFAAGLNKVQKDWMWSDYLKEVFQARIADLHKLEPSAINSFGLQYLEHFALPLYVPIAYIVSLGEFYVGIACFLGLTSRWAGAVAFFLMFNFAIGGYYDSSLLPLMALALVIVFTPNGHWLGLDHRYAVRYPRSILFR